MPQERCRLSGQQLGLEGCPHCWQPTGNQQVLIVFVYFAYLQDPMNLSGRNMAVFDHVKKDLRLVSEEEEAKLRASPILACLATFDSM